MIRGTYASWMLITRFTRGFSSSSSMTVRVLCPLIPVPRVKEMHCAMILESTYRDQTASSQGCLSLRRHIASQPRC